MSPNHAPALAKLARQINVEYAAIIEHTQTSLQRAMAAGAMLKEAKDKVGHGAWEKWLQDNCPEISKETASLYMRLDKNTSTLEAAAEANQQRVTDLSIRGAAKILAKPRTEGEGAKEGEAAKTKRAKRKAQPKFGSWALDDVLIALQAAFDAEKLNQLARKLDELAKPREPAPASRPPTPPLPHAGLEIAQRTAAPAPSARPSP
jgi:hypothetical protein